MESDGSEVDDINLEVERGTVSDLARTLAAAGKAIEIGVIVVAVLGVIAGAVWMFQTGTDDSGHTSHPFIGVGLGLVLGSIGGGIVYWALARALRLFGEYVAVRLRGESVAAEIRYFGRSGRKKECPECMEDAWEEARVCPHCGHGFACV